MKIKIHNSLANRNKKNKYKNVTWHEFDGLEFFWYDYSFLNKKILFLSSSSQCLLMDRKFILNHNILGSIGLSIHPIKGKISQD